MIQAQFLPPRGQRPSRVLNWVFGMLAGTMCAAGANAADRPPNFIVVFCDDMGYSDIGPFGAKGYETPALDRMAAEGMKFTDFYVGRAICTPSRAALLTGCIPTRVGIGGNFVPASTTGLNPDEMTIAEVLKQQGYATACFGKWHLGSRPKFMPTNQGFDEYFGIPYSNDMWPLNPRWLNNPARQWPPLPLFDGDKIVTADIQPADQEQLTTQLTERAVRFIRDHKDEPFFIYLPNPQPHVPLYASEKFHGKTERGPYGDSVSEIDWQMGEILSALKEHNIDEQTCVVFTSDNGPWLLFGDHAGRADPLRAGKGTCFEGGLRVPCVMRWPGRIPAGATCREVACTMDLLPTFAKLSNSPLPPKKIDGRDISALMFGEPDAKSPHEVLFHYNAGNKLVAMRMGKWKLIFPQRFQTPTGGKDGLRGKPGRVEEMELSLFDLETDISETNNVADQHPDIVETFQKHAAQIRADLGDGATPAPGRRPIGRL